MSSALYTYIFKNDGTAWCTGQNNYGQLGLGDTTARNVFTKVNVDNVKSVHYGGNSAYIMKNDGTVWSCGFNTSGQLGLGDTTNRNTFTKVGIDNVKSVSCGSQHTFILKNDGTLWTTGRNDYGQLGLGDNTSRTTFTKIDIDNVKSICPCGNHTIILKNDGTLWTTGYNGDGQLGLGDTTHRYAFTKVNIDNVKSVHYGGSSTYLFKNDGTVWSTGYNYYGQLGLGDKTNRTTFTKIDIDNVKSIYGGSGHTFILKNDGTVWSTGTNSNGQLGLGDNTNRTTFTKVDVADVKSAYCGYSYTVILRNDNTLWCVGYNIQGQLGLGDTTDRNTFTKVAIDDIKSIVTDSTNIETILYLIKTLQSKYTINKDSKTLSEITDVLTAQLIQSKGVDLDIINENIAILPDEFSLVSDKTFDLIIHGLKDNEQMVIASNDFLATIKEHVDYFKSDSTTTETSKVKVVFSIDSGVTWKTYQDGVIVDTSLKIPCKAFNLLSVEELEEWNLAKSQILLNGIDASILETIDFNTIEFDKIRFAYAMSVADIDDSVNLSKLIWQFDSKGSMQLLEDIEYDLKINSSGLEFKSLLDTEMIKVNIFPDGMVIGEDFDFATDLDVENMFV